MSPRDPDEDEMRDQDAASILLLRVALRLLGEARLRGNFGAEEALAERAVAIADELTGGKPSPDPRRAGVEVGLIRPDRIALAAPYARSSAVIENLMVDGTLYGGGGVTGYGPIRSEPEELTEEERAERERRRAEWLARTERSRQFTATRFVRALTPPQQPGAARPILAVLLYEDGFWLESTYDKEPRPFDPHMDDEQFFAKHRRENPVIMITDDVGTEYFPSGGATAGGVRVHHSSEGFAPAPPASARVLRITTNDETAEVGLTR
ncbi:MAG TPA: hypothetical protein VJ204_17160 [Solirubrobacterales bacterium]|nr:hypothetical protein [Solirubrobacterales bacterium]